MSDPENLQMSDAENLQTSDPENPQKRAWEEHKFFLTNYAIIFVLNLVQFCLTIYGNHKLNTDPDHVDYYIGDWSALKLDLAVSCLTWVFLAYGIFRHFWPELLSEHITSMHDWDKVFMDGVIWILQFSAAIDQTVFITAYFHCDVECSQLSSGSVNRNRAYTVFAWLLVAAWTLQLIYSLYSSRAFSRG